MRKKPRLVRLIGAAARSAWANTADATARGPSERQQEQQQQHQRQHQQQPAREA